MKNADGGVDIVDDDFDCAGGERNVYFIVAASGGTCWENDRLAAIP